MVRTKRTINSSESEHVKCIHQKYAELQEDLEITVGFLDVYRQLAYSLAAEKSHTAVLVKVLRQTLESCQQDNDRLQELVTKMLEQHEDSDVKEIKKDIANFIVKMNSKRCV